MEGLYSLKRKRSLKRENYLGNFKMNDFQIRYESGTGKATFLVTQHPNVEFDYENLHENNVRKICLEEFINATMEKAFSSKSIQVISRQTKAAGLHTARISENGFSFRGFNNSMLLEAESDTISLGFICGGKGRLQQGKLFMDFKIIVPGEIGDEIIISGNVIGERNKLSPN